MALVNAFAHLANALTLGFGGVVGGLALLGVWQQTHTWQTYT